MAHKPSTEEYTLGVINDLADMFSDSKTLEKFLGGSDEIPVSPAFLEAIYTLKRMQESDNPETLTNIVSMPNQKLDSMSSSERDFLQKYKSVISREAVQNSVTLLSEATDEATRMDALIRLENTLKNAQKIEGKGSPAFYQEGLAEITHFRQTSDIYKKPNLLATFNQIAVNFDVAQSHDMPEVAPKDNNANTI